MSCPVQTALPRWDGLCTHCSSLGVSEWYGLVLFRTITQPILINLPCLLWLALREVSLTIHVLGRTAKAVLKPKAAKVHGMGNQRAQSRERHCLFFKRRVLYSFCRGALAKCEQGNSSM